jgi:hypothetical protein
MQNEMDVLIHDVMNRAFRVARPVLAPSASAGVGDCAQRRGR